MKILVFIIEIILINVYSYSQNLEFITDSILNEGLRIYKLEKAAWISSDKLAENPVNNYLITGYIPFYDNDSIRTLFYYHDSFDTRIRFIGSLSIHDSLTISNLEFKSFDRKPRDKELLIIKLRNELTETMNSSPNLSKYSHLFNYNISVIEKDSLLQFYLLPGTTRNNMFYLGGDYTIKYSLTGKFVAIEPQHNSLIKMSPPNDARIKYAVHTHIKGFSNYITATDICQMKLYGKLTNNSTTYKVISDLFESSYNSETDSLLIQRR